MDDQLSEHVIGAAFRVYNKLGYGFLESVYEKSISIELSKHEIPHLRQERINVFYDEQVVGKFACDLLIDGRLIVELKSVNEIVKAHEVQLVNDLAAMKIDSGLLINFGPTKVEVKRKFRIYKEKGPLKG